MLFYLIEELGDILYKCLYLLELEMDLLLRLLALVMGLLLLELVIGALIVVLTLLLLRLMGSIASHNTDPSRVSVGVFHPYSGAGGGGERVLWCAVATLQRRHPHVDVVIYTGDSDSTHQELQEHVSQRFNISLPRPVRLVHLRLRVLLEARLYPCCTMLLQAAGSLAVGIEAMLRYRPDVFLDTMGYAFVYPLVKVIAGGDCKVACYIHYPTISTDMLTMVQDRTEAHNNAGVIARSSFLSHIKLYYYKAFAKLYGYAGNMSNTVMVNSSWTRGHISSLWGSESRIELVFPPCDITKFSSLNIIPYNEKLMKKIVSIGQFRPEKDHALQLRSFKRLLDLVSDRGGDIEAVEVQLVLVGGVRGPDDQKRVNLLQDLAVELGIQNQVEWKVNMPFDDLTELLQESCVGLHTMWNEHFGISVAEMQAAGLITVAHDSGGPLMDIVIPYEDNLTGLLASDVDSYAESIHTALTMCDADREHMQKAARLSAKRFSDENFHIVFGEAMESIISTPATVQ